MPLPSQRPVWPPGWTEPLLPVLTTLPLGCKIVRPYTTVIFHVSTILARIGPNFQPIVGTQ